MGLLTDLLGDGNATSAAFNIDPLGAEVSSADWSTFTQGGTYWHGGARITTVQNAEIVYGVTAMQGGTWTFTALLRRTTNAGIVHIAVSPDNSTWTEVATLDAYDGADTVAGRLSATGLQIPAGTRYLRLKMATKNASSSGYGLQLQGLTGVRTGDST